MPKTWRERIAEARTRGWFDEEDRRLAFAWATCAVGEQVAIYPERFQLHPVRFDGLREWDLANLGCDFLRAVDRSHFDQAENILNAIEDRVLNLKRGAKADLPDPSSAVQP